MKFDAVNTQHRRTWKIWSMCQCWFQFLLQKMFAASSVYKCMWRCHRDDIDAYYYSSVHTDQGGAPQHLRGGAKQLYERGLFGIISFLWCSCTHICFPLPFLSVLIIHRTWIPLYHTGDLAWSYSKGPKCSILKMKEIKNRKERKNKGSIFGCRFKDFESTTMKAPECIIGCHKPINVAVKALRIVFLFLLINLSKALGWPPVLFWKFLPKFSLLTKSHKRSKELCIQVRWPWWSKSHQETTQ